MFPSVMSNSTNSKSEEASISSGPRVHDYGSLNSVLLKTHCIIPNQPQKIKKKRSLPGNPDPDAEVIALSPKTLLATNRFVCEICNKGFQRDQNLQLHRRGHNLPWKLKQRNSTDNRKKAYVCPEPNCVHHHPSRALGDLTGIKKHFCRKHGEKKWKCEKCSKIYAVQSDWRAHSKTCGTREYRCDCGTIFSRKDSFITHRAFCDALAEETARISANSILAAAAPPPQPSNPNGQPFHLRPQIPPPPGPPLYLFSAQQRQLQNPPPHTPLNPWNPPQNPNPNPSQNQLHIKPETTHIPGISLPFYQESHKNLMTSPFQNFHVSLQSATLTSASVAALSATALLQKAATIGAHSVGHVSSTMTQLDMSNMRQVTTTPAEPPEYLAFAAGNLATWQKCDGLTRDFLGLTGHQCGGGCGGVNGRDLLSFAGDVEFSTYDHDHALLKHQTFELAEPYN